MKKLLPLLLILAALPAAAQSTPPTPAPSPVKRHALAKTLRVVAAPVVHAKFLSKATLGSVMFATENVVDVIHLSLAGADKAFAAISIGGKVPVIDSISAFVTVANTDTGKLDGWLERQEQYLFGTSN